MTKTTPTEPEWKKNRKRYSELRVGDVIRTGFYPKLDVVVALYDKHPHPNFKGCKGIGWGRQVITPYTNDTDDKVWDVSFSIYDHEKYIHELEGEVGTLKGRIETLELQIKLNEKENVSQVQINSSNSTQVIR